MKSLVRRVEAAWMGRAFAHDRDLQLPKRPRLIPELIVVPLGDDGLLFSGGEHDQVVRGKSLGALHAVLPVLDGRRTLDELARDVRTVPRDHLVSVVSLLCSRGLLEEGHPADGAATGDVASFLGRFVDATRANSSRHDALARLAAARVQIYGPTPLAEVLRDALTASGVSHVMTDQTMTEPTLEVVLVGHDAWFTPPRRAPQRLMLRFGASEFHVGPLLTQGVTSCEPCLARLHPAPSGAPDPDVALFFSGVIATQVIGILARVTPPPPQATFCAYTLDPHGQLVGETRLTPPMPGCDACGLAGAPALAPDDPKLLPWLYHWSTALPSRDLVTPKAHQMHYLVANIELARDEKQPLYCGVATELPAPLSLEMPPPWLGEQTTERKNSIDVARLATLLARAVGECEVDGVRRRVAPTGGNLGSIDAWIVARRLHGLNAGVYHYDAPRHRLEFVRNLPTDDAICAALGGCDMAPDALVVGTGALSKCAQKYGPFTYRLVHLDSGVALTYLHTLARALGIPAAEYGACSEAALANLLGLSPNWETPLPVFAVGLGSGLTRPRILEVPPPTTRLNVRAFSDRVLDYLLDELARTPASPPGTQLSTAQLPRPFPALRSAPPTLDGLLLSRRAVRHFTGAAVRREVAEGLLALSAQVLRDRVAAGAAACFARPVLAIAQGDAELPAGFYELESVGEGLIRRADFSGDAMQNCNNQRSLGDSPAAIWLLGDLAAASAAHGVRGYRTLAQHAGSAIAAAWLAAVGYGLGGTAAGGAIVGGLREAAHIDPYRECPLLGFHFGVPAFASEVAA
jgi:SagB-type dehydrogenase family enzyme